MAALAVTAGLLLPACSDDGDGDIAAWCSSVEELAHFIRDAPSASDFENMDDLEAALDDIDRIEKAVRDGAPSSLRDDVATIFDTDSDTLRVSEQEDVERARGKVNDYIREKCDLDVGL